MQVYTSVGFFSGVTNFKSQNERDMKKIMIIIINFFFTLECVLDERNETFRCEGGALFSPRSDQSRPWLFSFSSFSSPQFLSSRDPLFPFTLATIEIEISSLPILIQLGCLRVESCRRKKLTKQKHRVAGRTYV